MYFKSRCIFSPNNLFLQSSDFCIDSNTLVPAAPTASAPEPTPAPPASTTEPEGVPKIEPSTTDTMVTEELPSNVDIPLPLVRLICTELSSSNISSRQLAQKAIEQLSGLLNITPAMLLRPVREELVAGIISRPLRDMPSTMQTATMDAIAYCANLQLVPMGQEVILYLYLIITNGYFLIL